MSIGNNIRRLRERYGLSQSQLASIAGVTDKAVSTWENDLKTPRMGAIQKIADYFGIAKSEIIEDYITPGANTRLQMFLQNYDAIKYMLCLSESVDEDANVSMYNLRGDSIDIDASKRIDLFLAITKEAQSYVARGGTEGLNDAYDHLDEHGKAVVDAVLRLEQERVEKEKSQK